MNADSSKQRPRRSWPRRMLNRLEVDQAVFFSVAIRGWQLASGPFVLLLIAACFTPKAQGYYFTFASLLNLQWFAELGLRIAVLNLSSHEWASLRLEGQEIAGDPASLSRLSSLLRKTTVWFVGVGVAFAAFAGVAGWLFFERDSPAAVEWLGPWTTLVAVTGVQLALVPWMTLLDGCGQMAVANRYRLAQGVMVTVTATVAIVSGGALWTAPLMAAARVSGEIWLVGVRYRRFFSQLWRTRSGPAIDWATEVAPLQWRLAAQSLFVWFAFSLFNPVLFHYHGADAAGRMGMTWAALTAIHAAALAWVETRAPLFGALVARREFGELDRVYFRVRRVALQVLAIGLGLFVAAVFALEATGVSLEGLRDGLSTGTMWEPGREPLANRLLPAGVTAVFAVGLAAQAATQCQTYYLRAHKRDPLWVAAIGVCACQGFGVWMLGRWHGSLGAALAFTGVQALLARPWWTWIWRKCRRDWHGGGGATH